MNTTEEQPKPVPVAAVMSLLRNNTQQRDTASNHLEHANRKLRNEKDLHIATLGRLFKYEGWEIIDEALEYAIKEGLFISCSSEIIGLKTVVKEYTNKKGKTLLAHYSVYGNFIEIAKDGDKEPKYYNGNFLYKNYVYKSRQRFQIQSLANNIFWCLGT
jgi:hypothetical protein